MTVYVVQEISPNKKGWMPDFSTAAAYGEIKYIFGGGEKIYALHGRALNKARKFFKEQFNPEKDYILWPNTGDPMGYAIVNMVIGEMNFESISHLYWSRKRDENGNRDSALGFYIPIKICIKEIKDERSDYT